MPRSVADMLNRVGISDFVRSQPRLAKNESAVIPISVVVDEQQSCRSEHVLV